jgi:hypothetical protein
MKTKMIERILQEMGKSIESEEIKKLLVELGFSYPKKVTVTPNNPSLAVKFIKDGLKLGFHLGANHLELKPIRAKRANSYIPRLRFIIFDKKTYNGEFPFGVDYKISQAEIEQKIGKPKIDNFVIVTTFWKIPYADRFEFQITEVNGTDREIQITFPYDANLNLEEDYK